MANTDTPADKGTNHDVGTEPTAQLTNQVAKIDPARKLPTQPRATKKNASEMGISTTRPASRAASRRSPQVKKLVPSGSVNEAAATAGLPSTKPEETTHIHVEPEQSSAVVLSAGADVPRAPEVSAGKRRTGKQVGPVSISGSTAAAASAASRARGGGARRAQPTEGEQQASVVPGAKGRQPGSTPALSRGRGGGRNLTAAAAQAETQADVSALDSIKERIDPGLQQHIAPPEAVNSLVEPQPVPVSDAPQLSPASSSDGGKTAVGVDIVPTKVIPTAAHRGYSLRLWLSLALLVSGFFYIRMLAREEPELGSSIDPSAVFSKLMPFLAPVTAPVSVARPEPVAQAPTKAAASVAALPKPPDPSIGSTLLLPKAGSSTVTPLNLAPPQPQTTAGAAKADTGPDVPSGSQPASAAVIPQILPKQVVELSATPAVSSPSMVSGTTLTPEERPAMASKGLGVQTLPEVRIPDSIPSSGSKEKQVPQGMPQTASAPLPTAGQTSTPALLEELRAMERSAKSEPVEVKPVAPVPDKPQEVKSYNPQNYYVQPRLRPEAYYGYGYGYGYGPGYYGPYGSRQTTPQPMPGQSRAANQ